MFRMRFRRPPRQKWFYPFILCACSTLGYVAVGSNLGHGELLGAGAIVLVMAGYSAYWSWEAWSARIDVDQQGVRWQEGEEGDGLFWKQIDGLARDGVFLALVEKGTGRSVRLPFFTRSPPMKRGIFSVKEPPSPPGREGRGLQFSILYSLFCILVYFFRAYVNSPVFRSLPSGPGL